MSEPCPSASTSTSTLTVLILAQAFRRQYLTMDHNPLQRVLSVPSQSQGPATAPLEDLDPVAVGADEPFVMCPSCGMHLDTIMTSHNPIGM
jgi:hypothetical protein